MREEIGLGKSWFTVQSSLLVYVDVVRNREGENQEDVQSQGRNLEGNLEEDVRQGGNHEGRKLDIKSDLN